jgi:membrane protein
MKPLFDILGTAWRRFNEDKCWDSSIIISYFALLCIIPLAALFAFITSKILGNPELAFRSLNIFSEDFFAKFDPSIFKKVEFVIKNAAKLGLFGLIGSFVAGSFLFSRLIYTINFIFKANYQKSFFYNRLMEYVIMLTTGVILLFSLSITALWTALHRTIRESSFIAQYLNPSILSFVDNFLIQYLIPFALGVLVLFSLYKFIPEVKVHTRAALIAAVVCSILWEIFKRSFVFYVAHLSAVGIVLSKVLAGTLASIIFFLLWISFSLVILFWGAELAAVLNEGMHERKA